MAGIYIHIPFCRQACHYCDFHFSTNLDKKGKLLESLTAEISLNKDYLEGEVIETVYFGGGSPSLLNESEIESLLASIKENFSIISDPEITLEGNPDDLTFTYLQSIRNLGINRLSIGIQSFHQKTLNFLNRVHNSDQSYQSLENAIKAGFSNFSVDLIYGIPHRDHQIWESDLRAVLSFQPKHISAYCLTIEDKTAFGNWLKKGKLVPVDEDFAAEQFEMLVESLQKSNYQHYEISNFALPGFYSKHNSSYWKQKKYLGIGPGAHSFNGISRRFNVENNIKYIQSLDNHRLPYQEEILTPADKINEYILTTLRTMWGCDNDYLKKTFDYDLLNNNTTLEKLIREEYLEQKNSTIFLTGKGKLFADKITEELWVEFRQI